MCEEVAHATAAHTTAEAMVAVMASAAHAIFHRARVAAARATARGLWLPTHLLPARQQIQCGHLATRGTYDSVARQLLWHAQEDACGQDRTAQVGGEEQAVVAHLYVAV